MEVIFYYCHSFSIPQDFVSPFFFILSFFVWLVFLCCFLISQLITIFIQIQACWQKISYILGQLVAIIPFVVFD